MIDFSGPDYVYWRALLAGQEPLLEADKPQCGFYFCHVYSLPNGKPAKRERDPVAIYRQNDKLVATIWRSQVEINESLWLSVARHAITDEVFWDTIDNGRWADTEGLVEPKPEVSSVPGANEPVFGRNEPAEGVDVKDELFDTIKAARHVLEQVLARGITNQATADHVANSKDRLSELWDQAEAIRKKEKKPHDEAAAAVQTRWRDVLATANQGYEKAQSALTLWQKAERSRLEAEAAEARRKAEEIQRLAAEEARKAAEEGREPPPPPPEPPAIVDTRPRAGGALSGRRTGLREVNAWARVDDWDKLFDALKDNDAWQAGVRALAQSFADRAAKAKAPLPGTSRVTDEKAV